MTHRILVGAARLVAILLVVALGLLGATAILNWAASSIVANAS